VAGVRLENKVAVVTGSSSGIGEAIALALSREGAAVVVNYSRHEDAAQKVLDKIEAAGGKGLVVGADVSDPKEVEAMVQQAVGTFGHLDIMVNNAGMERKMPFLQTPFEVWQETIAVNLTGAWLGCQAAAKRMVAQGEGGRIINVSSVHEDLAMPTNSPYCATKGGVRMLMRTLAVELAPHDITVNNIAPGAIETPMVAPLEQDPDEMKELLSEIPLGRMGKPEEVANLALFLASEDSSYVTGSTLFVDGGMIRQGGTL
jgi:glucose 1-dehydrogenase